MAKTLEIVVPFGAGSAFDVVSRAFCDRFVKALGEPVLYRNLAGGEGVEGGNHVATAPADGFSLLVGNKGALTSHPHTDPSGFQPGDFSAVGQFAEAPLAIAVGATSRHRSFADLVEAARREPRSVTYSTPHAKHTQHLAISDFAARVGVELSFVTVQGGNPGAIKQIVANEVDFAFLGAHNFIEPLQQRTIRILGVTTAQRLPFLPDEPTCVEQGFDLVSAIWLGLVCRTGAPAARLARLRRAFDEAAADPTIQPSIGRSNLLAATLDHAAFAARLAADFELHGRVLRRLGIIA